MKVPSPCYRIHLLCKPNVHNRPNKIHRASAVQTIPVTSDLTAPSHVTPRPASDLIPGWDSMHFLFLPYFLRAQFISSSSQNVAAQHLALLVHIRDILGSNLDPETGHPHCGSPWFYLVPPFQFILRSHKNFLWYVTYTVEKASLKAKKIPSSFHHPNQYAKEYKF